MTPRADLAIGHFIFKQRRKGNLLKLRGRKEGGTGADAVPAANAQTAFLMGTLNCYSTVTAETKAQVVPVAPSLFDTPAVPVFRSAESVDDMRVGTEGPPPPSATDWSRKTESSWGERGHIVQIIYGWCSIHLKLRWNAVSLPSCRGISLNRGAANSPFTWDSVFGVVCLHKLQFYHSDDFLRDRDAPQAFRGCDLWSRRSSIPVRLIRGRFPLCPPIKNDLICLSCHNKRDWVVPSAECLLVLTVRQQMSDQSLFVGSNLDGREISSTALRCPRRCI